MLKIVKKMFYLNLFIFSAKKFDLYIRQNCRKVDEHDNKTNVREPEY